MTKLNAECYKSAKEQQGIIAHGEDGRDSVGEEEITAG